MDFLPHEKEIQDYSKALDQVREQNKRSAILSKSEIKRLEEKLDKLKERVYASLTAWDRVMICRHPQRPRATDYIRQLASQFTELCGDRTFGNDRAVVGGLAVIDGVKCVVVGQEKGCDTESRLRHNFGMVHPEGFRKALRLARLAEKFRLPLLFLVDTPGAFPGLTAEERGQGWAIAHNLREFFSLATPMVVVLIGEGCSGGALGMGIGDAVGMLEHAYYSVISPEGCASILWKDASKNSLAAEKLKLHAEFLEKHGIIDAIIPEPLGGAHHAPEEVYEAVKQFVLEQWTRLQREPLEVLLQARYDKFRKMGQFTQHETTL